MSAKPHPVAEPDSPEVAALRRFVRGESLTDSEKALLEARSRAPSGATVPHADVERLLAERLRRGE
jgi:hypothetical protein